jgi:hypothetical protein
MSDCGIDEKTPDVSPKASLASKLAFDFGLTNQDADSLAAPERAGIIEKVTSGPFNPFVKVVNP